MYPPPLTTHNVRLRTFRFDLWQEPPHLVLFRPPLLHARQELRVKVNDRDLVLIPVAIAVLDDVIATTAAQWRHVTVSIEQSLKMQWGVLTGRDIGRQTVPISGHYRQQVLIIHPQCLAKSNTCRSMAVTYAGRRCSVSMMQASMNVRAILYRRNCKHRQPKYIYSFIPRESLSTAVICMDAPLV